MALVLVALVLSTAGTARAASSTDVHACLFSSFIDEGSGGHYNSTMVMSNLDTVAHTYTVHAVTPNGAGVTTTVTIQPLSTIIKSAQALGLSGLIAPVEISTPVEPGTGLVVATLLLGNPGGVLTPLPPFACTVYQQ
jgi:hypothetical protein